MQIEIIKIGNSRGIRLPQSVIRECGFMDTIEAELINHCLILKAPDKPRSRWENLFKAGSEEDEEGKDILAMQNSWDDEEWVW